MERLSAAGPELPAPPGWMRWLPAAYVLVVLVLEPLTPVQWPVSFVLVALPAVAAFSLGPVGVAAATVCGVTFEALLAGTPCCAGRSSHDLWERHYVAAYLCTGLVGALGIALAAYRRRQEAHLVHVNTVSETLMRTLLRPLPARLDHVVAAGIYRPAEKGTLVGGDLFDVRATPAGARAVIGDVRGKGLQAVRTVAEVLGCFRQAAYEPGDLVEVAVAMERRLVHEAEALRDDELFVTAALVEYDAAAGRLTIVNQGHIEPVLLSAGSVHALTGPPSLPLGLGVLAAERPVAYHHPFGPGDVLVLCTDGLVEARDEDGAFYPLLDRLRHRFGGGPAPTADEVVDFLDGDLPRHSRAFHDDVAVLALGPVAQDTGPRT
ncbi:membrane protein [Streptomyces mashuensis]|uniref:Membrane protein n=1 Tax=Streptomyces mashuensis TaxID=33904 RepID=A0A919B5S7_9ACTN|nr:membrane protein [Streptomyces mashuensis]